MMPWRWSIGACFVILGAILGAILVLGCGLRTERARVDPELAALLVDMRAAYGRGDLRRALDLGDRADRLAPGLPEVAFTRGVTLTRLRQYAGAKEALLHVVEADPEYPGAWYNLGHNSFLQRRYRAALDYYEKERSLLRAFERDESRHHQSYALPTIAAQIGRTYEKLGVLDSARAAYEEALAGDSTLAVAHAWLSELEESEGDNGQALHHARRALRGNPGDLTYVYRVGLLCLRNGYHREAVPFLALVARRWPGHEGAAYNLGRALMAGGRVEEGRAFLDRVAEVQVMQEEALQAERGVETYPHDPQRWIALAGLMLRSGYLDKAEEAFRAALFLRPDDLTLQHDLANVALTRGDTTAAVERFETILQQDSTFADAWLNVGILYAVTGRPEKARQAWQKTLLYKPGDNDARAYLAGLP